MACPLDFESKFALVLGAKPIEPLGFDTAVGSDVRPQRLGLLVAERYLFGTLFLLHRTAAEGAPAVTIHIAVISIVGHDVFLPLITWL